MNLYSLRTAVLILKAKPQIFVLVCFCTFLFFAIRSKYFEESSALQPMTDLNVEPSTGPTSSSSRESPRDLRVKKGKQRSNPQPTVEVNKWDRFIQTHTEYQPIGNIWDKCDNNTRATIGKVVLEPNGNKRGVKMTMVSNLTFKNDVNGGKADLDVFYKNVILYRKNYELCDKLSKLEEPIPCPFKKGQELVLHRLVEMPSYLPKGAYKVHLRAEDQLGNEFACVALEFKTRS